MNKKPCFQSLFPLGDGAKLQVTVDLEKIASGFPSVCEKMNAAADHHRSLLCPGSPPAALEKAQTEYGNAVIQMCVCLFGKDATLQIVRSYEQNCLGFARALTEFTARILRPALKRYEKTARRYYGRLFK